MTLWCVCPSLRLSKPCVSSSIIVADISSNCYDLQSSNSLKSSEESSCRNRDRGTFCVKKAKFFISYAVGHSIRKVKLKLKKAILVMCASAVGISMNSEINLKLISAWDKENNMLILNID